MSSCRILIFSNARPSRAWTLAERVAREIPDVEICGIVQAPRRELPMEQQLIMDGRSSDSGTARFRRPLSFLHSLCEHIIERALSSIHGVRADIHSFTPAHLAQKCDAKGIPILISWNGDYSKTTSFVVERRPDFGIILSSQRIPDNLLTIPRRGWIAARNVAEQRGHEPAGTTIAAEWNAANSSAFTLAQLTLPHQPYDDPISVSLKADLLCDDLAIESIKHLVHGTADETSAELADWIQQVFSPYLEQLQLSSTPTSDVSPQFRHRPRWKLCLDTLLLCSPLIITRNWYRRLRRKYPITILTHHLVSDRPHRMGISTQAFWRQVRFLQRHYRIVSLAQAVELLKAGKVDAPTVVLTFDDGYADNFLALRAVAEETGVPITMFISTEPVTHQQEFQHDIENGIRGALPLTWEQLRYWSSRQVEFGAHTRTHFDCGSKNNARLDFEIAGSKFDLEQRLGTAVNFFAFPFGQPENMSAEAVQIVRANYPFFVSGFGGENHCGAGDGQHLRRKNLYANSWELELELQGIFDIVDTLKRSLSRRNSKTDRVFEHVPLSSSQKGSRPALHTPDFDTSGLDSTPL